MREDLDMQEVSLDPDEVERIESLFG
jgi:hypothetical protein